MPNGITQEATHTYKLVQVMDLPSLTQVWPFVLKGIQRIKARDKSCGHWTHHHIYTGIRLGLPSNPNRMSTDELFVAVDETGKLHGFIVTTWIIDRFLNAPTKLEVWLGYG